MNLRKIFNQMIHNRSLFPAPPEDEAKKPIKPNPVGDAYTETYARAAAAASTLNHQLRQHCGEKFTSREYFPTISAHALYFEGIICVKYGGVAIWQATATSRPKDDTAEIIFKELVVEIDKCSEMYALGRQVRFFL